MLGFSCVPGKWLSENPTKRLQIILRDTREYEIMPATFWAFPQIGHERTLLLVQVY